MCSTCSLGIPTCIPQTRTPKVAEVLCSHFFICRAAFSSDASSPCCLVPIFRSSTQGSLKWCTTFSSKRNSGRHVKESSPVRETAPPGHHRQGLGPAWGRVRQQKDRNQRTDGTNRLGRWGKGQNTNSGAQALTVGRSEPGKQNGQQ